MTGLAGRRVLVTGAGGFIGAPLCRRALAAGAEVHAVSRAPAVARAGVDGDGLRWIAADLRDPAVVRDVVLRVRPDVVLHLAAEVTGDRSLEHVMPMLQANLLASVAVMTAAAEAGCGRVVLAGSMEEPDGADALPQSPYAAAKWAAHGYARMLRALHGVPVVHLRVFMVYGPGQRDVRKLVPYVTLSLLRGEPPQLMSGTRLVDWIYVDDVVDAFLAAAVAPGIDGESLDVGTGRAVSVREVVDRLARIVGGGVAPVFGAVPERPLERVRVADPAPAAAALGWRPRVDLDDGLARTVAFYRARAGAPA